MNRFHWPAMLLAAATLLGCSHTAKQEPASLELEAQSVEVHAPPPPAAPPQPGVLVQAVTADSSPSATASPAASAPTRRLLVYHADVRLKTEAMPCAVARLDSLVRRYGAFVSASAETRADGEWRQETTIRVPPAQFQRLLGGLSGLGTVEEKNSAPTM